MQLQSFESSQAGCSGSMHRRELSVASPLCTRAASGPDVLLTRLAIESAGDTTSLAVPWCTTAWRSSRLSIMAMSSAYPVFSCTVLGLNAKLLVLQGLAPPAYSCILILRCQGTVVPSDSLCV